jgi:hypothetical protein
MAVSLHVQKKGVPISGTPTSIPRRQRDGQRSPSETVVLRLPSRAIPSRKVKDLIAARNRSNRGKVSGGFTSSHDWHKPVAGLHSDVCEEGRVSGPGPKATQRVVLRVAGHHASATPTRGTACMRDTNRRRPIGRLHARRLGGRGDRTVGNPHGPHRSTTRRGTLVSSGMNESRPCHLIF